MQVSAASSPPPVMPHPRTSARRLAVLAKPAELASVVHRCRSTANQRPALPTWLHSSADGSCAAFARSLGAMPAQFAPVYSGELFSTTPA